ncbi:hypothetical protein BDDG_13262 [Blastomyces dermatitidis ATCC 18188]|uniref:Uncharacterized protein n=1 Tax=Ajellomyces dermatitidis (strain ATCC 18188 / CBS 674.68) TaxID=653446 RepID=A0A0J9HIT2_AJEDA|nr:hypothetical protein BDDG_13262 [Blastomyces dermatitidis ATCC 18188]
MLTVVISLAADLHSCFGLFKLPFEAVDSITSTDKYLQSTLQMLLSGASTTF